MIAVAVCVQNGCRSQPLLFKMLNDFLRLQARIDDHAIVSSLERGNIGILLKKVRDNGV